MTINWEEILPQIYSGGGFILLFIVIFFFAKFINDVFTPYSIDEELTTRDNVALSVSLCGYFIAITIVFIGALLGPSKGGFDDLLTVGGYSLLGVILLNISRIINDKLILYKFSDTKEIIEDRNVGTGAVMAGSYIASGLIVAGAIHGEGGGFITALVFFACGQIALILFTFLYNLFLPFNIHDEIEKDNVAAGVAFGGTLIALGIILMKGTTGNFVSWSYNLSYFLVDSLLAFILLPVVRIFFNRVIIPQANLNLEITRDQNLGAGLLEMTVAVGFASILFFLI